MERPDNLIITGKPTNVTKKELYFAGNFFLARLFAGRTRLQRNVGIRVAIKNKFPDYHGLCSIIGNIHNPREFIVEIRGTLPRKELLKTLAHELTHAFQYASGSLKLSAKHHSLCRWNNITYDDNDVIYWEQPWEIEAYGREVGLWEMYKEYKKIHKFKP